MLRKTLITLAIAALAALPIAADDMSLDDVLASYYEAIGGLENLKGIDSLSMTGNATVGPGAEAPFSVTMKRPGMYRFEITLQGMTGIQASDGDVAWMVMPFMGKDDPEEMTEDQARLLAEQFDIDGHLVDWKAKGHEVTLAGTEEIEGTDAYKVDVKTADGDMRHYYLDAEYFIPIRMDSTTTVEERQMESETTLGDYKEVGGMMFAHYIESKPKGAPQGQVITVTNVVVNAEAPASMFHMPAMEVEAAE